MLLSLQHQVNPAMSEASLLLQDRRALSNSGILLLTSFIWTCSLLQDWAAKLHQMQVSELTARGLCTLNQEHVSQLHIQTQNVALCLQSS